MKKRLKNIQTFEQHSSELNISDVSDSLIGRKLIYKGKEYTIIDKHNTSDFVILDDENMTMVGLHWEGVEMAD